MGRILPEIIALGVYDAALVYKNASSTPPRRVRIYEIETVLEDGGVSWINGRAYPIRAGQVIIGKPGQMRHTDLPFRCLYLHLLVKDQELAALLEGMPDHYVPSGPAVSDALKRLIEAYTAPNTDAGMHVAAELCSLLSELIHNTRLVAGASCAHRSHTEVIERAIRYMDENCCQNISLEQVAAHVYLSRIYFHKLFRSATGRTPYRYLLEQRLSRAQTLLITTDLSAGSIAGKCGFSSQSYFNQVFLRELGHTPAEYRKQMSLQYRKGE